MPLISIIIPVYNAEKHLYRCLDSILTQKCSQVEIILVDDGSTDNSREICDTYQHQYNIIKVLHQKNGGPSAARNLGLKHAQGKYISFVDSDDYVDENYINILQDKIQQTSADIISFNFKKISGKKSNCIYNGLKTNLLYNEKDILFLLKSTAKIPFLTFVSLRIIKTEIIKKNHIFFDEQINFGEDTLFNLRCYFHAKSLFNISNCLYNYVANPNSITSSKHIPNFTATMISHFNNRLDFHIKNPDINSKEYHLDISQYYVEKIFFLLINNLKSKPDSIFKDELKTLRRTDIFDYCFKIYKNSNNISKKMQLIIYLFKTRKYSLVSKLIKL